MSDLYLAILKSMGSKYSTYAVQFASLMVLARLFTPVDFGFVAAVQVFYVFFQLVAEGGLGPAVIGLDHISSEDRDGIFGLTVFAGAVLGIFFFALTPVLVKFYVMPQLVIVIPYIALGLVFNAWSIMPTALLQRQQSFPQLAFAAIAGECIALAVVMIIRSYVDPLKALSLRLPLVAIVNFVLVQYFSVFTEFGRPRPGTHYAAMKPLLKVSTYQLAFNVVNYFSRNLDNILVGKYLGPSLLGIYDRSYQFMRYPLQLLTFAMSPAIQPALRSHSNDTEFVRKLHLALTFRLSLLGSVGAIFIYFLAKPIILITFGKQWLPSIQVVRLLSLIIPVQVILSTSGSFFQTFNRTDLLFKCGLFSSAVNVIAIAWGISKGSLEILCWCLFVSFHVNFFQAYYVLHKYVFQGGYYKFLVGVWPFMLTTGIMVVVALTGH